MTHKWDLRLAVADDIDAVVALDGMAFGYSPDFRIRGQAVDLIGRNMMWVAHLAGEPHRIVGTSGSWPIRVAMPDGHAAKPVDMSGLTWVSVRQDCRRKGVLRLMVDHHIEQLRDNDVPWSVLTASELGIYGRFGYGVAASAWRVKISPGTVALPKGQEDVYTFDLLTVDEGLPVHRDVWDRATYTTPGLVSVPPEIFPLALQRNEITDADSSAMFIGVVRRGDTAVAAAATSRTDKGTGRFMELQQRLRGLVAVDDDARVALVHYLSNMDLQASTGCGHVGADDPVMWAAGGPANVQAAVSDGIWMRPINLVNALGTMAWRKPVDVTITLTDPVPDTPATARLVVTGDGAVTVSAADGPGDVAMTSATLGTMALGEGTPASMQIRGEYTENQPGAMSAIAESAQAFRAPTYTFGF